MLFSFANANAQSPERLAMPSNLIFYSGYILQISLVQLLFGGSDGGFSALCALSLCDYNHIRQRLFNIPSSVSIQLRSPTLPQLFFSLRRRLRFTYLQL